MQLTYGLAARVDEPTWFRTHRGRSPRSTVRRVVGESGPVRNCVTVDQAGQWLGPTDESSAVAPHL